MKPKGIPIFVYGTLRQGFYNDVLLKGANFVGPAVTVASHAMYATTIPYVVKNGGVSPIQGELYFIDADLLAVIDELEEHPDWYRREQVFVKIKDGEGLPIRAWMYFVDEPGGELVPSGDFADA